MLPKNRGARDTSGEKDRGPDQPPSPREVEMADELMSSFEKRKLYREVTFALRTGIQDATAEFSFLRLMGLRNLLKALQFVANDEAAIGIFRHTQSLPDLQVIPILFNNTLKQTKDDLISNLDHIFGVDPMRICSPATDSEVALALRVLDGCCLLHKESKNLAKQHDAIKVIVNILSTRGALVQGVCLDVFLSLMLDSPTNQMDFESYCGIEKIAELIKDEQGDEAIRLKCGEFLLLLMGQISGREIPPLANVHEDIRQLLGEKCASLIWAASQFGSTLNPDQRQTALHIQARRVLESVELY